MGTKPERDTFLTVNYDGTFEEASQCAALAASPEVHKTMVAAMTKGLNEATPPLREALRIALQAWAVGSSLQRKSDQEESQGATVAGKASELPLPDEAALLAHLRETLSEKTIECAVLERQTPDPSKYRIIKADELCDLLPEGLTGRG